MQDLTQPMFKTLLSIIILSRYFSFPVPFFSRQGPAAAGLVSLPDVRLHSSSGTDQFLVLQTHAHLTTLLLVKRMGMHLWQVVYQWEMNVCRWGSAKLWRRWVDVCELTFSNAAGCPVSDMPTLAVAVFLELSRLARCLPVCAALFDAGKWLSGMESCLFSLETLALFSGYADSYVYFRLY